MVQRKAVTAYYSSWLPLTVVFAGAALAMAVAAGRFEPLLLAAGPLLLLVRSALGPAIAPRGQGKATGQREPSGITVQLESRLSRERLQQGGEAKLTLTLTARGLRRPVGAALDLDISSGLDLTGTRTAVLTDGRPVVLELRLLARERGVFRLGGCRLVLAVPGSLWRGEVSFEPGHQLEVLPRVALQRHLPAPAVVTGILPGSHRSRRTGSGVEFAGLRDYATGDSPRDLDWRASARWGRMVVRQRVASRNAEVVILLDALSSHGGTFDACVRVAAGAVTTLIEQGNRVGLVLYGGVLSWVRPGFGRTQRWKLLRRLRDAGVAASFIQRDLTVLPRRVLPPNATILAVTSLADRRFATVATTLKAQGWPVELLFVSPAGASPASDETSRLALRIWALEQRITLDRVRDAGVRVTRVEAGGLGGPGGSTGSGRLAVLAATGLASIGLAAGAAVLLLGGGFAMAAGAPGGPAMVFIATTLSAAASALVAAAAMFEGPGVRRAARAGPPLGRLLLKDTLLGFLALAGVTALGGVPAGIGLLLTGTTGSVLPGLLLGLAGAAAGLWLILRSLEGRSPSEDKRSPDIEHSIRDGD